MDRKGSTLAGGMLSCPVNDEFHNVDLGALGIGTVVQCSISYEDNPHCLNTEPWGIERMRGKC